MLGWPSCWRGGPGLGLAHSRCSERAYCVPVRVGPWRPGLGLVLLLTPVWPWALGRWLSTYCAQSWERCLRTMQATPSIFLKLVARSRGAPSSLGRRIFTPFFSAALNQRETLGPCRWGN